MEKKVTVIGAGLAGSEAAYQLAKRGISVELYEMRPVKQTPAHHTDKFAELVCTNSLRASSLTNAVGLIKEEMRLLDSLIMKAADRSAVPAGGALAVDRDIFSGFITEQVKDHPLITTHEREITTIPTGPVIMATGPLTSPKLSESICVLTGSDYLYFYDAAAPIIEKGSINMDKVYLKSRYDKGEAAYLNCPMNEREFMTFYQALIEAETAEWKDFEKEVYFEGCMPIEVIAKRGMKTLLFGPMKPVGLENPYTGRRPYAVLQLRQDDAAGTLYNLVGFQTHLKWGEQKRVFRLIPGLENVEIVRYGVMHRNIFINSPEILSPTYQMKTRSDLFFAGQITGVEGYVESAASGLLAGINAARYVSSKSPIVFPCETAIGSMAHYITHANPHSFQPMNVNFGLFPDLPEKIRDKQLRHEKLVEKALTKLRKLAKEV